MIVYNIVMKMHNYISLNLFSASSYLTLIPLYRAGRMCEQTLGISEEEIITMNFVIPALMLFLITAAVFLLFFVIEFFIRKKLKTEFFDINIENKTLRVIHVALFYIGAIILPLSFVLGALFYN